MGKEEVKEGEDILVNNPSRVIINTQNIEEKDKNIDNINTNFSHSQKNQTKEEIKVDNMMLNDKIDINTDNEQVAQQRKINNKKKKDSAQVVLFFKEYYWINFIKKF